MTDVDRYDYELPKHLIAQQPAAERSDARLMVVRRRENSIAHRHVRDLPALLNPGDCLVINDTRVIPARLLGVRTISGGHWEGLFLGADSHGAWRLLAKTRGKVLPGETITLLNRRAAQDTRLVMIEKQPGGVWLAKPEGSEPMDDLLERVGRIPLPHYIRGGEMMESDRAWYQTVFARNQGSVAAPTAGLHFTNELLSALVDRGVTICRLTLHVGLGTFRPISSVTLEAHELHHEEGVIDERTVNRIRECRAAGGRVVAVGTTTVRVLETAAADGELKPWSGSTDLFIRPPYQFRVVDALMTNFHLPRTTLLVLVRTFGGDELIQRAYAEAVEHEYRFFSYGDAMLIL